MATKEDEHYWRVFLYLNESIPLLSRGIILRKLDVLGEDLCSLVSKTEIQLRSDERLDAEDLSVLFPADGKANMDKWNSNLYICVTQTLFRNSLKAKERTKLKDAEQVLKDLLKKHCNDDTKIDDLTYEEHVEMLEEAFEFLSFNEDLKMRIAEIKKAYIERPLDTANILKEIGKMFFPCGTKEKLAQFLVSISATNESSLIERSGLESRHFETTKYSDVKKENQGWNVELDKLTGDGDLCKSTNYRQIEVGSDEIDAGTEIRDVENTSDEIASAIQLKRSLFKIFCVWERYESEGFGDIIRRMKILLDKYDDIKLN